MRRFLILILLGVSVCAGAQSPRFKLGKWTEIQTAILQELNRSYVDSLPIDRIERRGIDAMLADLDPYTVYIPEEDNENLQMMIHKTYGGIGAVIYKPDLQGNVIINEPYANSPAAKNGLVCGDEIMAIDGVTVVGLNSQQCSEKMRGEPGSQVVFKVKKLRSGEVTDITVTRERIKLDDIEYAGMLDGNVGYISQTGFTDGVGDEFRRHVTELKKQGMKTLVLDLRGNGGGLMNEAVEIVSAFVPKGSVVVSAQGKEQGSSYTLRTTKEPIDTKLPVIVLVDSGSASASEIVAGALQDLDRATIMGERTFGKGLVQSIRSLPYGGELKVTTAKYYTPSGRCVQAIDYAQRREDGSVAHIPDSLTHEFKTAHGRIVRDGGGITPDVELKFREYSRLTYSLVTYGIIEQYALRFVRHHEWIPPVEEFHLDSNDYEDFVEFAKGEEFDYRSSAKTYFDRAKEELRRDGLDGVMKEQLDALDALINMDKEDFLYLKSSEIIPFIEEEIAVRYYFQQAGVQIRIRYDDALRQALTAERIKQY
ncbi:MAG: S41 family peptidase [Bacteroidales bacterium]|nr:S41 family peptidase [Bacteroidales bacterium]MDY6443554.1 S41 family peptidase [Bacteroidales bacterium]